MSSVETYGTDGIALCRSFLECAIEKSGLVADARKIGYIHNDGVRYPYLVLESAGNEIYRVLIADNEYELKEEKDYLRNHYGCHIACGVFLFPMVHALKNKSFRQLSETDLIKDIKRIW